MFRLLLTAALTLVLCADAQAGRFFRGRGGCSGGACYQTAPPPYAYSCQGGVCRPTAPCPEGMCPTPAPQAAEPGPIDALHQVNTQRAARGLPPYQRCDGLTTAAFGAAKYRALYRIRGHVSGGMGDFQFLPFGFRARAAGCGALEPSWGFQACCVYDGYQYAGAASVQGDDGLQYSHVFVR